MSIVFLHGDCLEKMKDLSGASVDCFICDLPYGCLSSGYRASGVHPQTTNPNQNFNKTEFKTESCSWDIKINLDPFWEQVRRLRKNDHTPCLMFCTTKFGYELIKSNEKEFRYDLVWDKQRGVSFLTANKMPMRSHEMIYVFAKNGAYYNRVDVKGDYPKVGGGKSGTRQYGNKGLDTNYNKDNAGRRCVLSVLQNPTSASSGAPPTEKPMELYKFLLERFCPPGGTILDPTAGSFNSCFAAMELDRHAIGIEKDDKFYEKACKRADNL